MKAYYLEGQCFASIAFKFVDFFISFAPLSLNFAQQVFAPEFIVSVTQSDLINCLI